MTHLTLYKVRRNPVTCHAGIEGRQRYSPNHTQPQR